MKYLFLLSLCTLCLRPLQAQDSLATQPSDEAAFEMAMSFYEDESYETAIGFFRSFLSDYPLSELRGRAHYNLAYLLWYTGQTDKAIPVFKQILRAGYNERDQAGGIMEQYMLYKHDAATQLALIFLEKEEYPTAAKYIRMFDKTYPYQHFCGNEQMANEIFTATCYARMYFGQGKTDKAIRMLLPHLFYTGLADNTYANELLLDYLKERYTKEEIKALVNESLENISTDKRGTYLRFLGQKVYVNSWMYDLDNSLEKTETVRKILEEHEVMKHYL